MAARHRSYSAWEKNSSAGVEAASLRRALISGVTNSHRNPGRETSSGQKWCRNDTTRPLMCVPSWSWSVMIMTRPYRRSSGSWGETGYFLSSTSPKIVMRFIISALLRTASRDTSRTFRTLPRSGNTPNASRPTTESPATATALAESPSVRMSVHCSRFPRCPAHVASSSLGMDRCIRDRAVAEDLTSETFLRALRRIGSISYQGRDVGAWFITIARNLVLDHLKSSRFRLEISTAEPTEVPGLQSGPEATVLARAASAELLRAIASLGADQRECVVLRFLHGLSVAETAAAMDRGEGAIKALQHRAVRRLAQLLPAEYHPVG